MHRGGSYIKPIISKETLLMGIIPGKSLFLFFRKKMILDVPAMHQPIVSSLGEEVNRDVQRLTLRDWRRKGPKIWRSAFRYYAEKLGMKVIINDEEVIGQPLQIYLPDYRMAIHLHQKRERRRREVARNWLCHMAGIRLFRIIPRDTEVFDTCFQIIREDDQPDALSFTLSNIMMNIINDETVPWDTGILHHEEGVDLIPANIELSGLEVSLSNVMSRELILNEFMNHRTNFII